MPTKGDIATADEQKILILSGEIYALRMKDAARQRGGDETLFLPDVRGAPLKQGCPITFRVRDEPYVVASRAHEGAQDFRLKIAETQCIGREEGMLPLSGSKYLPHSAACYAALFVCFSHPVRKDIAFDLLLRPPPFIQLRSESLRLAQVRRWSNRRTAERVSLAMR